MALSLDFMHWIDRYVGGLLVTALQPFNLRRYRSPPPDIAGLKPARVLVVKFWGIGSIALAGSTLEALKRRYPEAEFHFLTLSGNRSFLDYVPAVDRVITLDIKGGPLAVAFRIVRLIGSLRRRRFDLVVDLEFFTRISALISFLSGTPVRVGFHAWEVWRGNLHNIDVPFNRYWHVTRNFFNLGSAAGVEEDEPPEFRLKPGREEEQDLARVLKEAEVGPEERVVVFNPNAGEMALERRWPPERFAALARELVAEPGIRPVFIGSAREREDVGKVVEAAGAGAVDLAGRLTLGALVRLFERADALITNDSGPLHLALIQGLPTLSFFGPETPILYGPRKGRHRVLYQHLACSPCINVHSQKKVRCVFGHPVCLETIEVERAATDARQLLAGEGGRYWTVAGEMVEEREGSPESGP